MSKHYDKCDLCGCGRAAPRHKRASMQSFHEFEEPTPGHPSPKEPPPIRAGEEPRATCPYCANGFPLVGGVHHGTQRLGMIPNMPCLAAAPPVERVEAVEDVTVWNAAIEAAALLMEFRRHDVDTNHWAAACKHGSDRGPGPQEAKYKIVSGFDLDSKAGLRYCQSMSTTTMYVFQEPDWKARRHTEFGNSWGWAAFVYEALLKRYRGKIRGVQNSDRYFYSTHNWPKLWEQEAEIPFEPWERNVLRATYDRAVVRGLTPLARIAGEMRRFEREHHHPWDGVCHLKTIGIVIEKLLFDMGHDWVPTAIGFQPTTCAADLWYVSTDDQERTLRPYDLTKDKLHHEVELVPSIWDQR